MGDVTWQQENVLKYLSTAANVTRADKQNIYQSKLYCLNVKYKIKNPLSMSRRASEELSKIKRCETNNINKIASKTNLGEKRIKKLLSVDVNLRYKPSDVDDLLIDEDSDNNKPCLADLVILANNNLQDMEKEIFLRWSGLKGKREGIKKISEELKLTRKETMSHLSSAKRTLRNRAKVEFDYA